MTKLFLALGLFCALVRPTFSAEATESAKPVDAPKLKVIAPAMPEANISFRGSSYVDSREFTLSAVPENKIAEGVVDHLKVSTDDGTTFQDCTPDFATTDGSCYGTTALKTSVTNFVFKYENTSGGVHTQIIIGAFTLTIAEETDGFRLNLKGETANRELLITPLPSEQKTGLVKIPEKVADPLAPKTAKVKVSVLHGYKLTIYYAAEKPVEDGENIVLTAIGTTRKIVVSKEALVRYQALRH